MENRISNRVAQTRLFKEKDELGISFCWETADTAVFERVEDSEVFHNDSNNWYYLIENFKTGLIVVHNNGVVVEKTDRILNLLRLKI